MELVQTVMDHELEDRGVTVQEQTQDKDLTTEEETEEEETEESNLALMLSNHG